MNESKLTEGQRDAAQMRRAKVDGWKFIELRYPSYTGKLEERRFSGVLKLTGYAESIGNKTKTTWVLGSGNLIFRWSEDKEDYVAFMLDDLTIPKTYRGALLTCEQLGSTLKEPGYNRNFLASQISNGIIEIVDGDVIKDVTRRAKLIDGILESKKADPVQKEFSATDVSLEAIEEQEALLKKRKEALLAAKKAEEPKPGEPKLDAPTDGSSIDLKIEEAKLNQEIKTSRRGPAKKKSLVKME